MIDPSQELFDLCDRDGRPTGERKLRPLVHRDGDWHRSFHCWVVTRAAPRLGEPGTGESSPGAADPFIILQRRADNKETWGGLWDVSVGGHYSAGEGIEGGIREMREELGLTVSVEELIQVGWRREVYFYPSGLIEREVQDIYFLLRDVALADIRTSPDEVSAVALIPATSLHALATGRASACRIVGGDADARGRIRGASDLKITVADLVPRQDGYYRKAAHFARALALGNAAVRRRRWW